MSVRKKLDALLDWYEQNKPEVRRVHVTCVRSTARRFARPVARGGRELFYRGRQIIPTKRSARGVR